jgi:ferredoxin
MLTEIYYFSGTGNSLFTARELQKRIPDSRLVPLAALLNRKRIKTKADVIGLVFPVYLLTMPVPVREFIKKLDVDSSHYIFAVCTRGGSETRAFTHIDQILKKKGKQLNARLSVNMAFNTVIWKDWPCPTGQDILKWDSILKKQLNAFSKTIMSLETTGNEDENITVQLPLWKKIFVIPFYNILVKRMGFTMYQNLGFYSDSKCTGCGICERVCVSGKIKINGNKPLWQKHITCYSCFACINFCPRDAVQIQPRFPYASNTVINITRRYHHPQISYADISAQKPASKKD